MTPEANEAMGTGALMALFILSVPLSVLYLYLRHRENWQKKQVAARLTDARRR